MKLLFFIGTLQSGGKERRLIELLTYLKKNTDHELMIVLRQKLIDYPAFYELNIPCKLLTDRYKTKDISLHFNFYKICKKFQPDIIHTWGQMPAFVSLFAVIFLRISHVNSQITSAPPVQKKWTMENLLNRINFRFSNKILSNSSAGLKSYNPPSDKSDVIYNGINLKRFDGLPPIALVKSKYQITTPYSVLMVASFTQNKNYDLLYEVAASVIKQRDDISFVFVGDGENFKRLSDRSKNNPGIILTGRINDVEPLVNVCDIGVLLSNGKVHGEGISNTITEYMALRKPVIANDAGGTREIVEHEVNGYLLTNESADSIADMIVELIEQPQKRKIMGHAGRKLIEEHFTIEKMGMAFEKIYDGFCKKPGIL